MNLRSGFLSLALASLFVFGSNSTVQAEKEERQQQDTAEVVEPIITEETLPNEVGEWDLRVSTHVRRHHGETSATLPRVQLFFGIAERLGGDIGLPLVYRAGSGRSYSFGPLSTSLKWVLVEPGQSWPAVTLGLEAEFPTGDAEAEVGERAYELTPSLALLKDFGAFSIQGNIGWSVAVPTNEEKRTQTFVYNWALAVPVWNKKVYYFAEINGAVGLNYAKHPIALSPGVKYFLTDSFSLAVAVPVGLTHSADAWGTVTQAQVSF